MSSLTAVSDTAFLSSVTALPLHAAQDYSPLQYFPCFYQAKLPQTTAEFNDTFRLRHQVYCEELCYEPLRPDNLERDQFDQRAIHCAITENNSGKLAGTVRLITSASVDELLPVEKYFAGRFTNPLLAPSNFPRQHICEISRLAVPKELRRSQLIDTAGSLTGLPALQGQCCRLVSVALYLLATLMCVRDERHHAYVMIEPSLARILKRVGIHFIQIGDAIEFNGCRAPYYVDMRTTKATLKADYLTLRNDLDQQLFGADETHYSSLHRAVG